jgi:carboxymethylenebutenolidase
MPRTAAAGVTTLGVAGSPGVLLLHPWWGVTPAVHWWAAQLMSVGRRVVVPDLYGGITVGTEQEAEALAQETLNDAGTVAFVERCADSLAADGAPWAAMGFSMGAFLACGLAGRGTADPDDLVLFYGGRPPRGADVRTRRVDLHVVPGDRFFDDGQLGAVEAGFRGAGTDLTLHRYPGVGHWFAETGSPGYDPAATALARDRVLDRLGVPAG